MVSNNNTQAQNDPFASADEPQVFSRTYYGQIDIDAWYCALIRGVGKVPFDESHHDRRATALDVSIIPLAEMNLSRAIERSLIAESDEWGRFVWASLKALGATSTRDLKGQWCKATFVPTGRTYVKDGATRESTTFKFLAFYKDEDACRDAFFAETGAAPDSEGVGPIPGFDDAAPAPVSDKERESAKQFVLAMGNQYANDIGKTLAWAMGTPMVAKHFGTTEAIAEVLAENLGG